MADDGNKAEADPENLFNALPPDASEAEVIEAALKVAAAAAAARHPSLPPSPIQSPVGELEPPPTSPLTPPQFQNWKNGVWIDRETLEELVEARHGSDRWILHRASPYPDPVAGWGRDTEPLAGAAAAGGGDEDVRDRLAAIDAKLAQLGDIMTATQDALCHNFATTFKNQTVIDTNIRGLAEGSMAEQIAMMHMKMFPPVPHRGRGRPRGSRNGCGLTRAVQKVMAASQAHQQQQQVESPPAPETPQPAAVPDPYYDDVLTHGTIPPPPPMVLAQPLSIDEERDAISTCGRWTTTQLPECAGGAGEEEEGDEEDEEEKSGSDGAYEGENVVA